VKREIPTTAAAPNFEKEIPTKAFEGFDTIDDGPVLVPEVFPVAVGDLVLVDFLSQMWMLTWSRMSWNQKA